RHVNPWRLGRSYARTIVAVFRSSYQGRCLVRQKGESRKRLMMCALTIAAISVLSCTRTPNPILGVWEGRMNELPAVELMVRDDNGELSGTIVFFFQRKDTGA